MAKVTLQNFCFWARKLQIHSSYPKTCHFRNVIPLVLSGANKFLSVIKSKQFRSRIFLPSVVEVQRERGPTKYGLILQKWVSVLHLRMCAITLISGSLYICSEQNGHLKKVIFFWESVSFKLI